MASSLISGNDVRTHIHDELTDEQVRLIAENPNISEFVKNCDKSRPHVFQGEFLEVRVLYNIGQGGWLVEAKGEIPQTAGQEPEEVEEDDQEVEENPVSVTGVLPEDAHLINQPSGDPAPDQGENPPQ